MQIFIPGLALAAQTTNWIKVHSPNLGHLKVHPAGRAILVPYRIFLALSAHSINTEPAVRPAASSRRPQFISVPINRG